MSQSEPEPEVAAPRNDLIYRTRLPIRLWHWINALCIFVMIMSGFMIFNAHPNLYWGEYGANFDRAWLQIGSRGQQGFLKLGDLTIETTGLLGYAQGKARAFPPLVTIPTAYNLAAARQWHFFFAWLLVVPGIAFLIWGFAARHLQRDITPKLAELSPRHLWHEVKDHARLRFPTGEAARRYNGLQKISYFVVIFVLIPVVILTGLTMSPAMNAGWSWTLDLFGGRQSARSIHFICAIALCAFIVIHLLMVVLAGPINELRSIVTGWYRLPQAKPVAAPQPVAEEQGQ